VRVFSQARGKCVERTRPNLMLDTCHVRSPELWWQSYYDLFGRFIHVAFVRLCTFIDFGIDRLSVEFGWYAAAWTTAPRCFSLEEIMRSTDNFSGESYRGGVHFSKVDSLTWLCCI
jgi:hypothetical protein